MSKDTENKAQLISLKQPKFKSSLGIVSAVRDLFKLVRSKQILSIVIVATQSDGNHYIKAVVPLDNIIIWDTLDAMSTAHEQIYTIGK